MCDLYDCLCVHVVVASHYMNSSSSADSLIHSYVLYCRCTCVSALVWSTSSLHPALRLIETDGVKEGEDNPEGGGDEKNGGMRGPSGGDAGWDPLSYPAHVNKHGSPSEDP